MKITTSKLFAVFFSYRPYSLFSTRTHFNGSDNSYEPQDSKAMTGTRSGRKNSYIIKVNSEYYIDSISSKIYSIDSNGDGDSESNSDSNSNTEDKDSDSRSDSESSIVYTNNRDTSTNSNYSIESKDTGAFLN